MYHKLIDQLRDVVVREIVEKVPLADRKAVLAGLGLRLQEEAQNPGLDLLDLYETR